MCAQAAPRRILIVALDNLGDLVFASALAPPLHAAFPDAVIDVWSKVYTADVARLIPHVRNVVASDPLWAVPPHRDRPPLRPFLRAISAIRRSRYDVAILSGSPWRTAAAVALTRIPMRVGLARRHNRRFLSHVLAAESVEEPVLREQARLLAPLGVNSENPVYRLDAGRLGDVRARIAATLPERFVALHPFAGARDRCVPLGEWTQVAFALHARDLPVLWIGTPHELNELRRSFTHPSGFYVDRLGDASLAETAAALSLATLFMGHDSGPLHVAAAFGVPVVAVFAPGQPRRTFPQGAGPSRMIARARPEDIGARDIVREAEALGLFSTT